MFFGRITVFLYWKCSCFLLFTSRFLSGWAPFLLCTIGFGLCDSLDRAMSLFLYTAPAAILMVDGVADTILDFKGIVRAFPLFLCSCFRRKLPDKSSFDLVCLSSINPRSHEYRSSFLSSGFIVLVSSTTRRNSLSERSRLVAFQLAFASRSCLSSLALALSFAIAVSCRNKGLVSLLFRPLRMILTFSLD